MTAKTVPVKRYGIVIQFLLAALVWGGSFLFMKVALGGVSFGQVLWSREILGALTLGAIVLIGRHRLPREPIVWFHFVVIALLNSVIPHGLFAWSQQHISSGLAGIYNSTTPIATAILAAALFRVERVNASQFFGIALGVLGVVVIIAPWQLGDFGGSFWGQVGCLVASACYGFAIGYLRKFISHRPIPGITVAFMTIGISGAIMLLLTPVLAIGPVELSWQVVGSLLLLGALGTGIAYYWNINVLRAWGATASSTVTYVIPVVAVGLGVLLLGETLHWYEPVGAAIILVGILFTQQRLRFGSRTTVSLGQ